MACYIRANHEKAGADRILADIDRRIAVTPPFPGLRHFHVGRGYKQWTGNDSKGLMKVYLPAIAGHVPPDVVQTVGDITELCYLVRRSVINEATLDAIDATVDKSHLHREVFRTTVLPEVVWGPERPVLLHHRVKAVKRPYRRTNHNKPLSQILLVNQLLSPRHLRHFVTPRRLSCASLVRVRVHVNAPAALSTTAVYPIKASTPNGPLPT
ncbi:hypothetical protein C8R45DRAFT_1149359 [Mycena sanguinolenta]|nr:hypothetical protein C8R45DRAFT_1149359 [Mycena sanguinolenta]